MKSSPLSVSRQDVNPETEDRANEVQQAAESQKNEVKVQFADEEGAADAVAPLTPLDEVGSEDDENRNKRFLSSLGGLSGSGSSGAGSGNFLFDILRVSCKDDPRVSSIFLFFFQSMINVKRGEFEIQDDSFDCDIDIE